MNDITELEKELKKVYKQASDEMRKKAAKYFTQFKKEDEEMRKALEEGRIKAKEYKQWRQIKMATGQNYKAMINSLTNDMTNANKIAASIINGYTPEAYAYGINFATYQIETGISMSTAWALYDRMTVERMWRGNPDLIPWKAKVDIPKDKLWNKAHINGAVMQSVLQGESIQETANRLKQVAEMNNRQAIRTARTAMTACENAGRIDSYKRASGMGIKLQKQWLATMDSRVRDSHAWLDGMSIPINETFPNGCKYPADPSGAPEEVYNCFLADTKIASDSGIVRSYMHRYNGKIISVKTSGGVQFSCTPNHPILTTRGWVAAERLQQGDDLVVAFGMNNEVSRRNPHINHAFPRIDTVHKFLRKFGSKRTCNLGVNFHGDIPTSNVEIITQKRFLRNVRYTSGCDRIYKFLLKCSDKPFLCKSPLVEHFRRVRPSTFSNIGSKRKCFSFIRRSLRHAQKHSLRPIALLYPCGVEPLYNDISGNIELIRKCLDGFSGIVFADDIISIDVSSGSTHVYNLQTENGYYFVNSIIPQNHRKVNGIFAIAHNCRCTMIADIEGIDQGAIDDYTLRPSEKLREMSYEEWKESHKKPKWMR